MKYHFISTNDSLLMPIVEFLGSMEHELGTIFHLDPINKVDSESYIYCLEVEEESWRNSLEFLTDFLAQVESINAVEEGNYKRVKINPKNREVLPTDFIKRFMMAAGPLWVRMGMCRIVKNENVRYEATDIAGPTYFFILSQLLDCVSLEKNTETKNKIEVKNKAVPIVYSSEKYGQLQMV